MKAREVFKGKRNGEIKMNENTRENFLVFIFP